jgi:hypothetical protein
MQRWLSILLGLAAVALLVVVVVRSMNEKPAEPHAAKAADAAPPDAGKASTDAATIPMLGDLPGFDAPRGDFARFPDGRPVPPLPPGSPKQIKLGVVLMTFAGAEGAPPHARDKKEALTLVTKLAGDAKTDFHAAVVRGDSGSSDDIGHIPRGILEPVTEYTVFSMPVGAVSDPIETPRGFWVAKRTE